MVICYSVVCIFVTQRMQRHPVTQEVPPKQSVFCYQQPAANFSCFSDSVNTDNLYAQCGVSVRLVEHRLSLESDTQLGCFCCGKKKTK